jgi:hypothetical protein
MFVKRTVNNTLILTFEEAKKIEFEMKGCKETHTTLGERGYATQKMSHLTTASTKTIH